MNSLHHFDHQIIPHSALASVFKDYARPNDKISRLTHQGSLISLKKGLYALSGNLAPPKELVANHLYGPSYVSAQWGLSYYGLLTERVIEVTSMCLGRSRHVENALGRFNYHALPAHYYSLGQTSIRQQQNAFLMATPEKALCDLLVSTRNLRLQSISAMTSYLLDDLRLDEDELVALDAQVIRQFAEADYKKSLLTTLAGTLEALHD